MLFLFNERQTKTSMFLSKVYLFEHGQSSLQAASLPLLCILDESHDKITNLLFKMYFKNLFHLPPSFLVTSYI